MHAENVAKCRKMMLERSSNECNIFLKSECEHMRLLAHPGNSILLQAEIVGINLVPIFQELCMFIWDALVVGGRGEGLLASADAD